MMTVPQVHLADVHVVILITTFDAQSPYQYCQLPDSVIVLTRIQIWIHMSSSYLLSVTDSKRTVGIGSVGLPVPRHPVPERRGHTRAMQAY